MVQRITPYLSVRGAAEAIAFYQRAFGATETMRMPADDGTRVLHAVVQINGGVVMLSDEFPEYRGTPAPSAENPTSVSVAIEFDTPAEVDATFKQAVAAGANGWMEPENMFWGARFAMLDDPFGHRWMLSAQLPQA
ncbi:MAG: VOC family protein [Xanthobacteraceae bacterium]